MLAIVREATVGPAGVGAAEAAVRQDLIPWFEHRAGAVEGQWMVDRATGRILTVTIWTDRRSLEGQGAQRGLGLETGHLATVLGLRPADVDGAAAPPWARVTRVEGLADASPADLEVAHLDASVEQSRSEGFRGSCWLGDGDTGQGVALSLWDGPHALIRGEHDSKRRRRELEQRFGARVTNVAELECLGVAVPRGR